jgi:hypothetical protein
MDKIFNRELYIRKADKYYKKYMNLKKQNIVGKLFGGGAIKPSWYDNYIKEVTNVYREDYVITGSGAVSIYLNYFNELTDGMFNELIPTLRIPNDIDFLYYCKGADYENSRKLGKYKKLQSTPQRSVTYEFDDIGEFPIFIKSFDLTCLNKISYVQIDKYKLLDLNKLLEFYTQEIDDNEMFFRNYKSKLEDIESRLEKAKEKPSISDFLSLEEEHFELLNKYENTNNKIQYLEAKINAINILIKNINLNEEIKSKYKILDIPDMSPDRDIEDTIKTSKDDSGIFQSSIFRKLFGSDSDDDEGEEDAFITPKKEDSIMKKVDRLSSSTKLDTGSSVFKKLDFNLTSPSLTPIKRDISSVSNASKVEYVPYDIKFDFEQTP